MKCRIKRHFIWVFTVCQSTRLGVSGPKRVKLSLDLYLHLYFVVMSSEGSGETALMKMWLSISIAGNVGNFT